MMKPLNTKKEVDPRVPKVGHPAQWTVSDVLRQRQGALGVEQDHQKRRDAASSLDAEQRAFCGRVAQCISHYAPIDPRSFRVKDNP